ncbi:zinc transporter ZntB [Roseibacterium sp. SDUM158016]|uniref:zinc transporter ZntB n=1 Tax=Roseicyclus sediminis TaxID=2980997 RepID=UPI0021CDFF05|nr:zinc transporter ZntB [Roseibacterium sp. SDUM158016]MCU4651256.1 zinc transporter ZntB [Roseibacterium sp. SDUM158016]
MNVQTMGEPSAPEAVAFRLDGRGGATETEPGDRDGAAPGGFFWLQLPVGAPETPDRLRAAGLDEYAVEALTAEETRPRCTVHEDGVVLILRGVNLHPDSEPEDMISVRLWVTGDRVIGATRRPLYAIGDLVAACRRGQAPHSPGDFVAKLALRLADRAEPAVADLNDIMDDIEEAAMDPDAEIPRAPLSSARRSSILLRRHLVPQRDALSTLEIEDLPWLADRDRSRLREAADRVTRLGEELDALRDRAQLLHDQVMDQRAERLNQRMLLLSVVASIFLPLSLLTGLLGINVGGIPGAGRPWAFWVVAGSIVVIGLALWWWFSRMGLLKRR